MSLLLKALKQAESAHADKTGTGRSAPDDGLELEPLATSGTEPPREWLEPPGLLFGNSGPAPDAPRERPPFRWPRISLVPLTALLAVLIALGYGIYLYLELQPVPMADIRPAIALTPATSGPVLAETPIVATPDYFHEARAPQPVLPPERYVEATVMPRVAVPKSESPPRVAVATPEPAAPVAAPLRFQPDAQSTLLSQAYAAYQRGALPEAQRLYTQAAARARSVDALLGLAAIASVQNREGDAQRLYREILDIDPRNATAQGALLDLLGNTDQLATESRLKTLIDRDPNPQLHQTLGNLYADQKRWSDAQAAYFEAYRGDPDNADYAFNLAVSLDQLNQVPAALKYYEKALSLGGVHRFVRTQAEARVQQLKSVR